MKRLRTGLVISGIVVVGMQLIASDAEKDPAHDMSVAETHWAFVDLVKPDVPEVQSQSQAEVDRFVLAKLEENGLSYNEPADKRSLLRRITYDLTGLPPSYEEVETFLADDSPDAFERVVDRLLASPAYGERWGRHWLDVARYADTKGIFRRGRYAFSHTYRDYVIQAFNEDKPYDRFILEQLAADQLELGDDNSSLAAMGFLTLGRTFFGRKDFIIDDQIDVVMRGLQGLTVTCARCHDHKSDPIPTADYYSLHGIFASSKDPEELPVIRKPKDEEAYRSYLSDVERLETALDAMKNEVIDKFIKSERSKFGDYLSAAHDGRSMAPGKAFNVFAGTRKLRPEWLRLVIDYLKNNEPSQEPALASWYEGVERKDAEIAAYEFNQLCKIAVEDDRSDDDPLWAFLTREGSPGNPDRDAVGEWIGRKIRAESGDLTGELMALDWTHAGAPTRAHILADIAKPKNSAIYKRGNSANLGEKVPRQFLRILTGPDRKPFEQGSGRLELAKLIADEKNPLTARVMVNRIWAWHFGKGIVDTPSDFGMQTEEPLHLNLLNWLASTFIENDWSIKHMHRLMVLSEVYRQSSTPSEDGLEVDAQNKLLHHFPKRRLGFEAMRDTLLAVSGKLNRTMGGQPVDVTDALSNRRTVYSFIDRQDMPGIYRTFDLPSPEQSSPGRFETVVPQQALFLMNSPFTIEQSKQLAKRIEVEVGQDTEERIGKFYQVVFQREPNAEEIHTGAAFIESMESMVGVSDSVDAAEEESKVPLSEWELYAQALLLSNELMFID